MKLEVMHKSSCSDVISYSCLWFRCLKAREPHRGVLHVVILYIHALKAHVEALSACRGSTCALSACKGSIGVKNLKLCIRVHLQMS